MKKVLFILFVFVSCNITKAQFLFNDSLLGFDLNKTINEVSLKNLNSLELKVYVNRAKKDYIKNKYQLEENQALPIPISKYGSSTTFNIPCVNEDFESSATGTLGIGTWTAQQGTGSSYVCTGTSTVTMSANTSAVVVYSTPVTDAICGTVGTSPFGGTKVVKINDSGFNIARIKQSFPVTSSNWLFNYAYMGVLSQQLHGCCDDAFLMFRFFDCIGNPISSLSQTVVLGTPSCVTTSSTNWALSTVNVGSWPTAYTPNWQIVSLNLSAYTNSCLTIEVTASACSYAAHPGYMYFDANCSNGGAMIVNGGTYLSPATDYTSCVTQTTLSALPGFSNYLWLGPTASGVSGNTNSAITTSVSGIYTVVANFGSITSTQTLNLLVNPLTLSVTGNNTICAGETTTLQVSGSTALNTFAWNTTATLQSISVTPSVTTTYSVIATNTLGCSTNALKTITVFPIPSMSILSSTPSICIGQGLYLIAGASGASSYSWNTGVMNSSITVSPTLTSVYSATGTTSSGCKSSASSTITVYPLPQVQLAQSSQSLCLGQSAAISATSVSGNSYSWSNGATTNSILVSPSITSVYSVIVSSSVGCVNSNSTSIIVHPLPQIQLITSNTAICTGSNVNIGITGSNFSSVLWNTGTNSLSISMSPSVNSVYSATVTSAFGCIANKSTSIIVNPLPQAQIVSSSPSICAGESATLTVTGSGLVNYLWSGSITNPTLVVSPNASNQYVVMVTDTNGCTSNTSFDLVVVTCTTSEVGINELELNQDKLIIFPNPSDGTFEIKGKQEGIVFLIDELGQIVSEFYLNVGNNYKYKIINLAKGVYFIKNNNAAERIIVK